MNRENKFLKIHFILLLDNPKECQFDCSVDSQPSYENMAGKHELTEMKIHFVNKTNEETSVIKKWCRAILPTNVMINITCKRPEVQSMY